MLDLLTRLNELSDRLTGTDGSLGKLYWETVSRFLDLAIFCRAGPLLTPRSAQTHNEQYIAIIALVVGGYVYTSTAFAATDQPERVVLSTSGRDEAAPPEDPPRNFTLRQLRLFDGRDDRPVYLSVAGAVFDVSSGRDFYGPGGPYEKFAGRECGVALAKMSFDEEHLDDLEGTGRLNFGEKTELENWIDKFKHYRNYPVKGRLVADSRLPDPNRTVSSEVLAQHNGRQATIPEGYAAAPIYVGAGDRVFDMSFGGVTFYGPGSPYERFAGRDASRALAKMSLDEADLATSDVSDLTEKQRETMNDWIRTFAEKKHYPVVGRLEKTL